MADRLTPEEIAEIERRAQTIIQTFIGSSSGTSDPEDFTGAPTQERSALRVEEVHRILAHINQLEAERAEWEEQANNLYHFAWLVTTVPAWYKARGQQVQQMADSAAESFIAFARTKERAWAMHAKGEDSRE